MDVLRFAAFSDGAVGGNPAGVVIADELPSAADMQDIARDVGYSETAFAARIGSRWRVRYFSPASEIPFCGHATIALGAALVMRFGNGAFPLMINAGEISVEGRLDRELAAVALQSPATHSEPAAAEALKEALDLFGLRPSELDQRVAPWTAHAGADHIVLMLSRRSTLAAMNYDFHRGRVLMMQHGWATILLGHAESAQRFHVRNAFAFGGVYEDPATGAAAAALAGLLRDVGWPHDGRIELHQGDDMGMPCRLTAEIPSRPGASIRVSGTCRAM